MTAATQQLRYIPLEGPSSDRVYLPASALSSLVENGNDNIIQQEPLTFQIVNPRTNLSTHCGVLEFSADESTVKITRGVADLLALKPNDLVLLARKQLPRGTKVSLRPLESGYNVDDWKSLLEYKLQSSYTTLSNNDIIIVENHKGVMKFLVEDLQPADAVCVIDTDLQVDIIPLTQDQAIDSKKKLDEDALNQINGKVGQEFTLKPNLDINAPLHVRLDNNNNEEEDDDIVIESNCRLMVVGFDHFPTKEAFEYSNITGKEVVLSPRGDSSIYITIYPCKDEGEITLSSAIFEPAPLPLPLDKEQCSNCKSYISPSAMLIHSAQCLRNNIPCPQGCGQVFDKRRNNEHWHCNKCNHTGNDLQNHEIHDYYFHTNQGNIECECGQGGFKSIYEKSIHCGGECGLRLHICKFCHLLVPQGKTTNMERLAGYSGHEAICGSRTGECEICKMKTIRLRDMKNHLQLHEMERLKRHEPRLCSNVNCLRIIQGNNLNNEYGLCNICFGPIYSTRHDPIGIELKKRIERRYYIQLTKGCQGLGKWCKNEMCKSQNKSKGKIIIKQLVDDAMKQTNKYWFCVDESTNARIEFANFIMNILGNEYSKNWCIESSYKVEIGDVDGAIKWLNKEAVRVDEIR